MASEIIDIVTRFTTELKGVENAQKLEDLFRKNSEAIGQNTASLIRLQKQLDATADPSKQAKINAAMQNRLKTIEGEKNAIKETILNNREYHKTLQKEMGILGSLEARLEALQIARKGATSIADLRRYTQEIERIQNLQKRALGLGTSKGRPISTKSTEVDIDSSSSGGGILSTIGGGIMQGLGIAGGLGVAGAIAGSINAIKEFGKESFTAAANFEQLKIAFATMTGSQAVGDNLIKEIQEFARVTPYGTAALVDLSKQLLAYGFDAKEIIPTLDNLGNVAAGVGKDKMPQLILAFGQVRASGKLMGQELLQFVNAGFNPLQEISIKTGKSMAVLRKEMEKGNITFDMVKQAFESATSAGGKFNNLMQNQTKTTAGAIDAMGDSVEKLQIAIGSKFTDSVGEVVRGFTSLVDVITDWIELSPSEEVEKERVGFNALVQELILANKEGRDRTNIITQLNSKYPTLIGFIDLETASNSQLYNMLNSVNGQYKEKIRLAGLSQVAQEKEKEAVENSANRERSVQKIIKELTEQGATPDEISRVNFSAGSNQVGIPTDLMRKYRSNTLSREEIALSGYNDQMNKLAQEAIRAQGRLSEAQTNNSEENVIKRQIDIYTKRRSQLELQKKFSRDALSATIERTNIDKEIMRLNGQLAALQKKEPPAGGSNTDPNANAETSGAKARTARSKKEVDLVKEAIESANREFNAGNEYLTKLNQLKAQKERVNKDYLEYLQSDQYGQDTAQQRVQRQRFYEFDTKAIDARIDVASLEANSFQLDMQKSALDNLKATPKLTTEVTNKINEELQKIAEKSGDYRINIDEARIKLESLYNTTTPKIGEETDRRTLEMTSRLEEEQTKIIEDEEARRAEIKKGRRAAEQSFIQEASNMAIAVWMNEWERKKQLIDEEISYRESKLDYFNELATRGNVEALKEEEARIDELYKKREETGRKQIALNAVIQASEMAKSTAEAIGAIVAAASGGDPYTIALRITAAVASLVAGVATIKSAFNSGGNYWTGGYTGDGGKYEYAGNVHKGEFVANQSTTRKYRPILEDMHKGVFNPLDYVEPKYIFNTNNSSESMTNTKALEGKLDAVVEAVYNLKLNAVQKIDANGVAQSVELFKIKDRKRWS